jgi:hypothetical protein
MIYEVYNLVFTVAGWSDTKYLRLLKHWTVGFKATRGMECLRLLCVRVVLCG